MSFPKAPFQSIIADSTSKVFGVWQQWFDRIQSVLNAVTSSGRTIDRPTGNLYVGQQFFDTDLNQEVFWNGTTWTTSGNGSITVGTTTTGAPGTNASVVNVGTPTSAVLDFTIPAGVAGPAGATGDAATVNVGTTITGLPGTLAKVTNSGTQNAAIFNFTIPRGNTGDTGAQGPMGPMGPQGPVSYASYGSFYDTSASQTAASITVDYPIKINTTSEAIDVFIQNDPSGDPTLISFNVTGVYNIQYSIQFNNTDTSIHEVDVWLRINDTGPTGDIAYSKSVYAVTSSHGGIDGKMIAAINYVLSLNAGDYLQLMWHTTSTQVTIQTIAAGTTPITPASPGVILTATQVR